MSDRSAVVPGGRLPQTLGTPNEGSPQSGRAMRPSVIGYLRRMRLPSTTPQPAAFSAGRYVRLGFRLRPLRPHGLAFKHLLSENHGYSHDCIERSRVSAVATSVWRCLPSAASIFQLVTVCYQLTAFLQRPSRTNRTARIHLPAEVRRARRVTWEGDMPREPRGILPVVGLSFGAIRPAFLNGAVNAKRGYIW